MIETDGETSASRPAGYAALVECYGVEVVPHSRTSRVAARGARRVESGADRVVEVFPPRYWPGDAAGEQLEFALKHDGTNLAILARLSGWCPKTSCWPTSGPGRRASTRGGCGSSTSS